MKAFCIGHKPPCFQLSQPYTLVSPESFAVPNIFVIPDNYFGDLFHGSVLSEYTQLIGLAEFFKISNADLNEKVFIFQYRKFISLKKTLSVSTNNPWTFTANSFEAQRIFPSLNELDKLPCTYLLGPCVNFSQSLAKSYAISHIIEDFVGFCIALRSVPGFTAKRCALFLNCEILIPAPSLGVTTIGKMIEIMDILKAAWYEFASNYYTPRSGYQRRVGGFLLERLHSFLLYEFFFIQGNKYALSGNQITVSETPHVEVTI
jgi:hypothetical protein